MNGSIIHFGMLKKELYDLVISKVQRIETPTSWDLIRMAIAQSAGSISQARTSLKEAKKQALLLKDDVYTFFFLKKIAQEQVRIGKRDDAQKTLNQARKRAHSVEDITFQSTVLKAITRAQALIGDIDEAKKTAHEIKKELSQSFALIEIAKMADEVEREKTFKKAKKIAYTIENTIDKAFALIEIASAAGSPEISFKEVRELVDTIKDKVDRSSLLRKIASVQVQSGNISGGEATLTEIENTIDRCHILIEIAIKHTECSNIPWSREKAIQAREEALQLDSSYFLLKEIVRAQSLNGDIDEAKTTITFMKDRFYRSIALSKIAEAQITSCDIAGAKYTAFLIKESAQKFPVLRKIILAQFQHGNTTEAKKTLKEMKETARLMMANTADRASTLIEIALTEAKMGKIDAAKKTLTQAKELGYCKKVALAQGEMSDFTGVRETILSLHIDELLEVAEALSIG